LILEKIAILGQPPSGCNGADGPKDKPDGVFIFCRGPNDIFLLCLSSRKP